MKKIAIVHPEFIRMGGGEAVCCFVIKALCKDYDVKLITFSSVDFQKLNDFFGTNFKKDDFLVVKIPLSGFLQKIQRFSLVKQSFLWRILKNYFKKHSKDFNLVFGTFNEMDVGTQSIQYIHFPVFGKGYYSRPDKIDKKWYKKSFLRNFYLKICKMIAGFSENRMKNNITAVNSKWSAVILEKIYAIKPLVIYPPIAADFPEVPFEKRENGFLCIGRITPEKKILKVISILKEIRKRFNIHLHIIGNVGDKNYFNRVCKNIKQEDWIFLEKNVSRNKFINLILNHKYGIHGMENEHFGIVIAEMIKAGLLVFVPDGGGQKEIVNFKEDLIFKSKKDAVGKIARVLKNENLQTRILEDFKKEKNRFSVKRFEKEIKKLVEKCI